MKKESLISASVTDLRWRCTSPQCSRGVHLNMIKQPLGLCGWEMQIYRLAGLHLNANVACGMPPSALKASPSFVPDRF